jgi:hypothetical protein
MKLIRTIVALCSLAAATLGAAAVATAAVKLPEWGRCVAVATGRYRDAGCTEHVARGESGTFEWQGRGAIVKRGITAVGTEVVIESATHHTIICNGTSGPSRSGSAAASEGAFMTLVVEPNDLQQTKGTLSFKGCFDVTTGVSCGELNTPEMVGVVGFISGGGTPHPAVGLRTTPVKGGVFAEAACPATGPKNVVLGRKSPGKAASSVISHIQPVDQMATSFEETYEQAGGIQSPTSFESGKEGLLEASFEGRKGPFERVGLQLTYTNTTEEALEIRAYCHGC